MLKKGVLRSRIDGRISKLPITYLAVFLLVVSGLAQSTGGGVQGGGTQGGGTQGGGTQGGGTQGGGTQGGGTQGGGKQGGPQTGGAQGTGQAKPPVQKTETKPDTKTDQKVDPKADPKLTKEKQKELDLEKEKEKEKEKQKEILPFGGALPYGYSFFTAPRSVIRARLASVTPGGAPPADALKGLVGPAEVQTGNISTSVPERYQLGPGDVLLLRFWSPTVEAKDVELTIDQRGSVVLGPIARRVTLRGQTLAQAESTLRKTLREELRDAEVTLTLKELRTMSITILGDAFLPGNYQVPSVATFFNTLYAAGGPSDTGTLRKIELRRNDGTRRTLDVYKFLSGGESAQDIPLQPGDTIFIPPAGARIGVIGEVYRPAAYEINDGEKFRDLIRVAGGIKPSGVAQRVSIEQNDPGIGRKQVDVNFGDTSSNPPLFNGDVVEVTSVRPNIENAIMLEGAVDQPGRYQWIQGMTVSQLIERARGLLLSAYPTRADIFRLNADGSTSLIPFSPSKASKGDAKDNVPLQRLDRVVIYSYSDAEWMGDRQVTVQGAVRRPGQKTRSDNMTVYDLIFQSGGLDLDAFHEQAYLQRFNKDGTNGPLLKIDLNKVAAMDPSQNVVLQDRDQLQVLTVREARFVPEQSVEISGPVQMPKVYPLASNLTVRDLIQQAGDLKPDAYLERAYLVRTNPDGTFGPMIVLDLKKVMANDPSQNVAMQSRDRLTIYTKEQAKFIIPPMVTIRGAVQRPGVFQRSEGMRLQDLIDLAGGRLPDAAGQVEIGSAYVPIGTKPKIVNLDSPDAATTLLLDGDFVSVQARSDILAKPISVTIIGAVTNPGPYLISGRGDRLSDVLKRAGKFTDLAFPEGAQFARKPEFLSTQIQRDLSPRIVEMLGLIQAEDYQRAVALSVVEKIRITAGASTSPNPSVSLGGASPTSSSISIPPSDNPLFKEKSVTPARALRPSELLPVGNISVNFKSAIRRPGGEDDIILRDGDIITIPEKPNTILITGAVTIPSAILYRSGTTLREYLLQCGGPMPDASLEQMYIIHADGHLSKGQLNTRLQLGDLVFIPTKIQAARLTDSQTVINNTVGQITNAAILYGVIKALAK